MLAYETPTAAPAMSETEHPLPQLLHDRFELVRELGRGGYATVYLARDRRFENRLVAAKVLRQEMTSISAWSGLPRDQGPRPFAASQHPPCAGQWPPG